MNLAEGLAVAVRGGFCGSGAPAWEQEGEVAVRVSGEQGSGAASGLLLDEVVSEQRGAQAGDGEGHRRGV